MSYNTYHTDLKIAVSLGLVPHKLLFNIPRSSRHRFKKHDFSSILCLKESDTMERIFIVKEFITSQKSIGLFKAAIYLRDTKIRILQKSKAHTVIIKKIICSAIDKTKDIIGLGRVAKVFAFTPKTCHNWKSALAHKCPDSAFYESVKAWPNQLTKHEVNRPGFTGEDFI